jgi:hypothetical protein
MKRSWKASSFFISSGLEELGFQVSKAKAGNGRIFIININAAKLEETSSPRDEERVQA